MNLCPEIAINLSGRRLIVKSKFFLKKYKYKYKKFL